MATSSDRILSSGLWVAASQGAAAVGHLVGLRILTEALQPEIFGTTTLMVGAVALVASGAVNPTLQAMLAYYPDYRRHGQGGMARRVAARQIEKIFALLAAPLGGILLLAACLGWASGSQLALLAALTATDVARMRGMALLNATQSHRAYGAWSVAEAWGRPAAAYAAVFWAGAGVTSVLAGFLSASVAAWLMMRRFIPQDPIVDPGKAEELTLAKAFWTYSLPLFPLGLLGWVAGMGDRYLIGALLTRQDVGLYAAVYGLASRPMLMLGTIVETTMRPVYQQAVVDGDVQTQNTYIIRWLAVLIGASLFAVAASILARDWMAAVLLGEPYRHVANFIPWITAGYAILILAQVATRVCYARGRTWAVLAIEVTGTLCAVAVGAAMIATAGLLGAVVAIPIYFGLQCVAAFILAWPLLPRARNDGYSAR